KKLNVKFIIYLLKQNELLLLLIKKCFDLLFQ
ncbi:MAG: hypothetical protein JWP57_1999, partial [Spirosoma sp.]|nr:hypothetical protein [Spirosoma sp.]